MNKAQFLETGRVVANLAEVVGHPAPSTPGIVYIHNHWIEMAGRNRYAVHIENTEYTDITLDSAESILWDYFERQGPPFPSDMQSALGWALDQIDDSLDPDHHKALAAARNVYQDSVMINATLRDALIDVLKVGEESVADWLGHEEVAMAREALIFANHSTRKQKPVPIERRDESDLVAALQQLLDSPGGGGLAVLEAQRNARLAIAKAKGTK